MEIDDYIQSVENSLSSRPNVVMVENAKTKRLSEGRAVVAARLYFYDDSFLDFRERVDTYRCYRQYLTYSYQYVKSGEQVFRYDNAPDHPEVSTFPDHKHIGPDDDRNIIASERPSYRMLFNEINQHLGSERRE